MPSTSMDMSTPQTENLHFPEKFLFGTATAGFQVEMGCPTVDPAECEDRASDWYAFITDPATAKDPGLHIAGDPPSSGPGFYELYEADLDRAKNELGNNALRLSIEWSRVFPTSTVGLDDDALAKAANPKALAWYHKVFAAMKARGLQPFVTLNHYSLPSWIDDTVACHKDFASCAHKGWADRDVIVKEMARYAGFVAKEFGGEVDLWASLNEPLTAVILAGFLFQTEQRTNPPGVTLEIDAAKTAMVAMIEAHARMYDAVKAADTKDADGDGKPAEIGIVYNLQAVAPSFAGEPLDLDGAKNAAYLMNQAFLDGVAKGDLDADLSGKPVHRDDLANRLDFLGINYYAKLIVQGTQSTLIEKLSPLLNFNVLALDYDWNYPKGISEVIQWASERYKLPIYISETGAEDKADDGTSSRWLVQTLHWVLRAIRAGADVRGYFYWTLMDNYEWNHGMGVRMGLYAVDKDDKLKARKPRSGVATYHQIAGSGQLPSSLATQYPID